MSDEVDLRIGNIYFLTGFFDCELQIPSISTFIYEGYDDEYGHLFRDAASHVNAMEGKTIDGGNLVAFPENEINGILDKPQLVEWLLDEQSPKKSKRTIEYKVS